MGGLANVTLGTSCHRRIESITAQIESLFERLERDLSAYRFDSAVCQLEDKAGKAPLAVSEDVFRALSLGKQFGELSGGTFDITVTPLARIWGFGRAKEPTKVPSEQEIREQMKLVDYRRLALAERTAFLPIKGMAVDMGGIAKGYAVDRAFELCRNANLEDFLIDLSGNIRASGRPAWRETWQIGVRDPFDRSRILGKVNVPKGWALATSGSYERFVLLGDTRYSHAINPQNGRPVNGTAAATILGPDATTADGLSTPFFISGLKEGENLLRKTGAAEVMIVPDKYPTQIWLTPGFARTFTPVAELAQAVRLLGPDSPPGESAPAQKVTHSGNIARARG